MKLNWRRIMSYFREEVVEVGDSKITPGLQVWYAYGRLMLNSASVNYSFGRLDKVFRSAFKQLKLQERCIRQVLLLGLGAGNVSGILAEYDRQIEVTAVEIDPEVIRLGKKHFGLRESPQLRIVQGDALQYVWQCTDRYDMVVVDLFVDAEVPPAACTPAYLQQLAGLLRAPGLLVFNRLAHDATLHQQSESFGRKMKAALPGSYAIEADANRVWVYEKMG